MISAIDRGFIKHALFAVGALLLAFHLRIDELGKGPMRFDEALSVWEAQMSLPALTEFTASDVHPPLYFWTLHVWLRLAGISEFAIRALSVFFGLLSALIVYSITWRLSRQPVAAAIAILLVALSPFHAQWSQDARMYALATMCASLAVYAYWRAWLPLFAIAGIGTILSHYFGVIVLGVLVLHGLLRPRATQGWRQQWLLAIASIAAVCALWAAYAVGLIRTDSGFATFDPLTVFKLMATLFTFGEPDFAYSHLPYVLLIAAIYFLGLALNWQSHRRATSLILLGSLAPPACIALLGLPFIPVHVNAIQERHFVIFAPFVFAGFGIGLAALARHRRLRPLALILGVGLVVLNVGLLAEKRDARYFKDDYRTLMAAVAALTSEDDLIFFISGGRKPDVYYNLDRVGYAAPKNDLSEPLNVKGIPTSSHDVPSMMEWLFAGIHSFWLIEIEAHHDAPLNARIDWITERYHRIYHIPVGWNGLSFFSKDENDTPPDSDALIPPVVSEARPADQVRIGAPAGVRVDLAHHGQVIDSKIADTWMLHQFDIYSFYFNGRYELRVADERYPFTITHSQDFPGA